MTDRELLELAAMAYWGSEIDDVSIRWLEEDQCIGYTHADNQDHNGNDVELCWNPLLDDGDAFRLAADLRLDVLWAEHSQAVVVNNDSWANESNLVEVKESYFHSTKYEALRHAIVRAAAEVAKQEVKP